jgi:hypothetical protein
MLATRCRKVNDVTVITRKRLLTVSTYRQESFLFGLIFTAVSGSTTMSLTSLGTASAVTELEALLPVVESPSNAISSALNSEVLHGSYSKYVRAST